MNKKAFNVFLTIVLLFSTLMVLNTGSLAAAVDPSITFVEEHFIAYEDAADFEVVDVATSNNGKMVAALVFANSKYYVVVTESGEEFGDGIELNTVDVLTGPCDIEINDNGQFIVRNSDTGLWFNDSERDYFHYDNLTAIHIDNNRYYYAYYFYSDYFKEVIYRFGVEDIVDDFGFDTPLSATITSIDSWNNLVVCGLANGKLFGITIDSSLWDNDYKYISTGMSSNVLTYPKFMTSDATNTVLTYTIENGVQLYYATCSSITGLPSNIPTSNRIDMAGSSAKTSMDYLNGSFYVVNKVNVNNQSVTAVNRLTANQNWNVANSYTLDKLEVIDNVSIYSGFGVLSKYESLECIDVAASNKRIYALVNDHQGVVTKKLYSCLNVQNDISNVKFTDGNLNTSNIWTGSTLAWGPATNATSYRVQITSKKGDYTSSNALVLTNGGVTANTSVTLPKLTASTTYFYRIRVESPLATDWYEGTFTTGKVGVTAPKLISPADKAYDVAISNNKLTVNWSASTNANYYAVFVSESEAAVTNETVTPFITDKTSAELSNLDYYTTYYWKVVAFRSSVKKYVSTDTTIIKNKSEVGKFTTALGNSTKTTTTTSSTPVVDPTKTVVVTETLTINTPVTVTITKDSSETIVNTVIVTETEVQTATLSINETVTVTETQEFSFMDFDSYSDEQWLVVAIAGGVLIILIFALIVALSKPRA